jgi:hypothetical protein
MDEKRDLTLADLTAELRRQRENLEEVAIAWRERAINAEARIAGALRVIYSAQAQNERPDMNSVRFYLES